MNRKHGQVALVHFDAHLDTWDTYFGAPYTHGTLLRRAAEEGLFREDASMHVGIRGPLYSAQDMVDDAGFGFRTIRTEDVHREGVEGVVQRIRERVGDHPLYVSIDIDSLDPAHAPGTGTPEVGGLTSRELLMILRGLAGLHLVSADVVEVSPPYDHAELTSCGCDRRVRARVLCWRHAGGRLTIVPLARGEARRARGHVRHGRRGGGPRGRREVRTAAVDHDPSAVRTGDGGASAPRS